MPEGTNYDSDSATKQVLTVVPKPGVKPSDIEDVLESVPDDVSTDLNVATSMINETADKPYQPALSVASGGDEIAPETVQQMRASGQFEYVDYAIEYHTMAYTGTPNDPGYTGASQNYLKSTTTFGEGFDVAWNLLNSYNNTNVKVAVIDTGWVPNMLPEPQEGANISGACKMTGTSRQGNLGILCGSGAAVSTSLAEWMHGTNVAMVIGATTNNATGMAGAAYDTPVNVYSVMDSNGDMVDSSIGNMLNMITNKGANAEKVVNISLGSPQSTSDYNSSNLVKNAIQNATNAGITVVAAAGNSRMTKYSVSPPPSNTPSGNPNGPGKCETSYPASDPNVISVGATNGYDSSVAKTVTYFSDCNSNVNISAEGWNVLVPLSCTSASNCTPYARGTGTSYSSPQVAAAAALLYRIDPTMTPAKVRTALDNTAQDVTTLSGITQWGFPAPTGTISVSDDCNSAAHLGPGRDDCTGYGILDIGEAALSTIAPVNGNTPVYRLICPWGHFWTANVSEVGSLLKGGCRMEGNLFWNDTNYASDSALPVYRLAKKGSMEHFWTINYAEAMNLKNSGGWNYEGIAWYQNPGIPVYRLNIPGEHFYTASLGEAAAVVKAVRGGFEGIYCPPPVTNLPVYRLLLPSEHFYTVNANEAFALIASGNTLEGVGWYTNNQTPAAGGANQAPVYRIIFGGMHFFTANVAERNAVMAGGGRLEGIGFYYDSSVQTTPIYRLLNLGSGEHFFTASSGEKNSLQNSGGWRYEGIGWYGK
jgi:hypothetical protein